MGGASCLLVVGSGLWDQSPRRNESSMTKIYALLAGTALVTMIGGTAIWTNLQTDHDCGTTAVAGATIGGPFELLDGAGQLVTDNDVINRPALVYFGYSFCPDVCPFDVARNAVAIDLLEEQSIDVKPVFVTIDPGRDTPEVVAEYATDMHPKMVGLTGSDDQIKAAANAYRVYYKRGTGDDEYYLMDHSTFTYLMLPETGLAAYFKRETAPEDMAKQTACLIAAG